jgi:hypothetical protein
VGVTAMRAIRALNILAVLAISAQTSLADYHYASHEGSNTYPYTSWATAAHLIQDAVDATSPHDTLYVGSGEWYESIAVEPYDSISFIGMGWDSTYIWSDGYHIPTITLDYDCSLENVKVSHPDWMAIWHRARSSVKISNCKMINSYIAYDGGGGNVIIQDCIFDNNFIAVFTALWSSDIWIFNNVFYNTHQEIINLEVNKAYIFNNIAINEDFRFGNIVETGTANDSIIIKNNLFHYAILGWGIGSDKVVSINNTFSDFQGGPSHREGYFAVCNNCIYDNNAYINVERVYDTFPETDSASIRYNSVWGEDSFFFTYYDPVIDTTGLVRDYPMFMGTTDFHLQAYSPLIDAGDPDILDIDGSRSDIGAFGGPGGSSYAYLDLAPLTPDSLSGIYQGDSILITWRYNYESDFSYYHLHRDTVSGFQPTIFNLISEQDTSYYIDSDIIHGRSYYYKASAIDNQDNMSDYSEELAVIASGLWDFDEAEMPNFVAIEGNYPNPFNSRTTIVYWVANLGPIPAQINIDIYDLLGRKVRTLLDDRKGVGKHRIVWDGRDDAGLDCTSGVYFARISQWGVDFLSPPLKLTLIK